jgi:hypothetical protein
MIAYHGTTRDFDTFDHSKLGESAGGVDTYHGFCCSATIETAETYLDEIQTFDAAAFTAQFGMTLEDAKTRITQDKIAFKKSYAVSFDDYKALPFIQRRKMERDIDPLEGDVRKIDIMRKNTDPTNYTESSPLIIVTKIGYIKEIDVDTADYQHINMDGQAWDANKQSAFAKEAKQAGFDGIVFQNMQDSGWFGGTGEDDIIQSFQTDKLKITGEHIYNEQGQTYIDALPTKRKKPTI